ncbi:unnamed protein product [Porites lobata]|uniref:Pseudouridylate synthase PUS7L N-terminal domain-containing protein n=1 Tax=Porites lobata TaxID=104759 RepID=A0ABN8NIB0_9CNID|nr:unnamed protein product [Porites lobata]
MSFGAECFLCCELNGFKGQIKKTWQDFVVTEIDSQGNQVKLIPGEIVSAMENEQDDQSSRSKTKLKKEKREKQQEEKSLDDVPFFNKMLDSFEELKDVALKNLEKCLSSEKMIELSEFAMFVETNRDTEKRISLGSVPSKELRTGLHRNIRLAFPHLLTETTKSDQEGQPPLILVGYDKVYWEFSNLLNDRDQVDR